MNSNANTSLAKLSTIMSRLFYRFGFIVIFLIVTAGLVVSILLLSGVIAKTDDPGEYTPTTSATSFDKTTIENLENLSHHSKVDTSGRLLPFN